MTPATCVKGAKGMSIELATAPANLVIAVVSATDLVVCGR